MPKRIFGKYGRHKRISHAPHFWGLSALSVVMVFSLALLSRAELRLSGEILAAGDGDDLAILMELHPEATVELIREDKAKGLRLYILKSKNQQHLVEVIWDGEQWVVADIEKLRE